MVRIVIVDDNVFLQKAVAEKLSFFEDLTLKFTALNGVDLLDKLAKNKNIDLILMDIEMPECNGIEATKLVKDKYPQIKTYTGINVDNPHVTAKIDYTVFGFHAKVFDGESTYFIDPYTDLTTDWYLVYYKKQCAA